jgi:hypothetical protein
LSGSAPACTANVSNFRAMLCLQACIDQQSAQDNGTAGERVDTGEEMT